MSTQEVKTAGTNFYHVDTDLSKIFLWQPRSITANYTNGTGDAVELKAGRIMGRISASSLLAPHAAAATNGSQIPLGILMQDITVASMATVSLTVCVSGDVAEGKVITADADTLATVIAGRTLRDRIGGDTVGINLIVTDELTGFDNA